MAMTSATKRKLPDVVVTGVAMTTALGTDVDTTWQALLDGRSGIRLLEDESITR
ncbi:MAG: beta-ketoacyl-ACP synthase, partial [Mycobacterium sp.]|nr:beta-ketoacyl-ACP synthase [Mycobacterium sp.]